MKTVKTKEELRNIIIIIQGNEEEIKTFNDKYDYSSIIDMEDMLRGCKKIKTIPFLDLSNVIETQGMFYECESLETIPNLNTSNIEDTESMFHGCKSLKEIPLLDINKSKDIDYMFYNCNQLIENKTELIKIILILNKQTKNQFKKKVLEKKSLIELTKIYKEVG